MKVIYVAGPLRASNAWDQEQNIRRAEELSLRIWRAGAAAICPHAMNRYYQNILPDETWLRGDFEIIRRCDALYLLPKWETSEGTLRERTVAVHNKIRLLYGWVDFEDYLSENPSGF